MPKKPLIAMPLPKAMPSTPDQFVAAGQPDLLPEASKPSLKRLTIDIDADMHRKFKVAATHEGRDMREIVAELIDKYLKSR